MKLKNIKLENIIPFIILGVLGYFFWREIITFLGAILLLLLGFGVIAILLVLFVGSFEDFGNKKYKSGIIKSSILIGLCLLPVIISGDIEMLSGTFFFWGNYLVIGSIFLLSSIFALIKFNLRKLNKASKSNSFFGKLSKLIVNNKIFKWLTENYIASIVIGVIGILYLIILINE